ncbi:MAG: M23 family metallopeptidase [Alphaproteobacteria bacterium]|nr:M23 family metallopeptidase [Alphaproteobacteria bacterium]
MRIVATIALLLLMPAQAEALSAFGKRFTLGMPVACVPGESCFIQNYVSHDEETGELDAAGNPVRPKDYTCGALTQRRHYGTDFRVEHEGLLNTPVGIPILAAAAGKVTLVKTGEASDADPNLSPFFRLLQSRTAVNACGTRVQIEHRQGWVTHYCHMKPGSLKVGEGDEVQAGQVIGLMGMSGNTSFPHLHFEVWQYGNIIDPFIGVANTESCASKKRYPIWDEETYAQLTYQPSGLLAGGFTAVEPKVVEAREGKHRETILPPDAPMLVFWSEVFGMRKGDRLKQEIFLPDGTVLAEREEPYEKNAALVLQSVTKPREEGAEWPKGLYRGRTTLYHEGKLFLVREWPLEVK